MKHIDLHTYGKTPACVYLAFKLSEINDQRLASRVGQSLSHFRDLLRSLENANHVGVMTQHQMSSFANMLRNVADEQHAKFVERIENINQIEGGEIIADLVRNIMIGELKSLLRRGASAKHEFKAMQRDMADVPGPVMSELVRKLRPRATDMVETITPETLTDKSLAKLQRKGKISTLY